VGKVVGVPLVELSDQAWIILLITQSLPFRTSRLRISINLENTL
jgi:hypothetical protein